MKWGNESATDEEIITALKHAQAWEFVDIKMVKIILTTRVVQGGDNYSVDQKQRLTIARSPVKIHQKY